MILKKPYAFLIKHFKLIHLIITLFLGITAYQCKNIYDFLNKCIENNNNRYDALNFVNYNIFIYIIIAIILMSIIRWLLKYKDKPRTIYLYSILYYSVIIIVLLIIFLYLDKLPREQIVQKTIRIYRDISFMILIIQYIITVIMFIRGLGFDIKKFNFRKDFEEMHIQEEDAEEIEVNAFSKVPELMNVARKQKRELGYYYKENKLIINIILVLLIAFIIYNGYKYFNNKMKIYEEGDIVGTSNLLTINETYYKELNNKKYIILSFSINTLRNNNILNSGVVNLKINEESYTPDKNICYKFKEKGICYKKQVINKESNNYIFVYEVKEYDHENTFIDYSETYNKNYIIRLKPQEY